MTASRPATTSVVQTLASPDPKLLKWKEEDKTVQAEAALLGADLSAGTRLYEDLQGMFVPHSGAEEEYEDLTNLSIAV